MHKQVNATKRNVVTVDDRRAVMMSAKGRKPSDVAKVSTENFIRQQLKQRMGWPQREPAPEGVKVAARELAAVIKRQEDEARAKRVEAAKAAEDAKAREAVTE